MKLIKTLPCGEKLYVTEVESGREYSVEDNAGDIKTVWTPSTCHRVVLLQAILAEDGFKYQELNATQEVPPEELEKPSRDCFGFEISYTQEGDEIGIDRFYFTERGKAYISWSHDGESKGVVLPCGYSITWDKNGKGVMAGDTPMQTRDFDLIRLWAGTNPKTEEES